MRNCRDRTLEQLRIPSTTLEANLASVENLACILINIINILNDILNICSNKVFCENFVLTPSGMNTAPLVFFVDIVELTMRGVFSHHM